MSTTIQIIPTKTTDITFGQVIETSERHINDFLASVGIEQTIQLKINLHENSEKYVREIQLTDKFEWEEHEYIWFTIHGIVGGTDAYCSQIADNTDPDNPWWFFEDLELNNKSVEDLEEKLEKAKTFNRTWSFRRSAGQPGIIALSYGLISASVAELTEGLLWSDDGAWEFERFPAESEDFLYWYFNPDKTINAEHADWAQRCIGGIAEELLAAERSVQKTGKTWWQKLFNTK